MVFVLAFPVTKVKCLCSIMKSFKVVGVASVNKAIFDTRCEPLIIFGLESLVVKTGEHCIFIEFNIVFGNVMGILHRKIVEFSGG